MQILNFARNVKIVHITSQANVNFFSRHTYEAAVNSSSPFLRGNCQSCYVQSQNLTVDSQLREEVETYLQVGNKLTE